MMHMKNLILLLCLLVFTHISLAQDETQTPYGIALERILEADRIGATTLDLTGLGLTELPLKLVISLT
jgi:hypothetical protein